MARSSSLPGIPAGSSGQQGKSLGRPERGGHPVTGVGRRPAPCRLQGQATGTHTQSYTHAWRGHSSVNESERMHRSSEQGAENKNSQVPT